jgi:hypothetical protein
MKNENIKIYYQCLSNAGGYWGKIAFSKFEKEMSNNKKFGFKNEIKKIYSIRKSYYKNKIDQKENIKIIDLSLPIYIQKVLFIRSYLLYMVIPIVASIFYLPLYLMKFQNSNTNYYTEQEASKFVITSEFMEDVLNSAPPPLDLTPPSPPQGVTVKAYDYRY